jgi:hypothetical protein
MSEMSELAAGRDAPTPRGRFSRGVLLTVASIFRIQIEREVLPLDADYAQFVHDASTRLAAVLHDVSLRRSSASSARRSRIDFMIDVASEGAAAMLAKWPDRIDILRPLAHAGMPASLRREARPQPAARGSPVGAACSRGRSIPLPPTAQVWTQRLAPHIMVDRDGAGAAGAGAGAGVGAGAGAGAGFGSGGELARHEHDLQVLELCAQARRRAAAPPRRRAAAPAGAERPAPSCCRR